MRDISKNRFTLKIILSYLVLVTLAGVAGYFIFTEIKTYFSEAPGPDNDTKLLKTSSLLTKLYEAESISKLALQTKTRENFSAYERKIDTLFLDLDTLRTLTQNPYHKELLDSVQTLLQRKMDNSNELRKLKVRNDANSSIDNAMKKFNTMEASLGKITPEALAPNIDELSPKAQSVIRDMAAYLNDNVPRDTNDIPDSQKIDSILNVSKALLTEIKQQEARTQRFLAKKEMDINQNDLELSQQLRSIIQALEQEVMSNSINENLKKQVLVKRSTRLAGGAAILGIIVVAIFTFLIYRDFWKVQTYRLKLEREKKYSESLLKSREQLIATVSHDLRTPLNTISGYVELMESTGLTARQMAYLKNVRSASQYVDRLVNDLLDFSRLEAGKIKLEKIPFVLGNLIRETAYNLRELHKKKSDIELLLEVDERLETAVKGDPFRIRQILTNLIGNAYKFTEKGFIKVKANVVDETPTDRIVVIKVIDSGIGIPKKKQRIIFREFTQAKSDTDKKYGGYGLGLTISRKLAELLGGSLNLISEMGKGSTFIVRLPLEISAVALPLKKSGPKEIDSGKSVLIIDDDTAMLQMLTEMCKSIGIKPIPINDFKRLDTESPYRYSVVLTDIQMPGTDGFEVLKSLKSGKYKHYSGQAVIAMTGRRDLEQQIYTKAGFTKVLAKPFTKGQLMDAFEEALPIMEESRQPQSPAPVSDKSNALYDFDLLLPFVGGNRDALEEVLATFIKETGSNLKLLSDAINKGNLEDSSHIAHRMLPMCRQIRAQTVIPYLEKLENIRQKSLPLAEVEELYRKLAAAVAELLSALKRELSKSPSYSG